MPNFNTKCDKKRAFEINLVHQKRNFYLRFVIWRFFWCVQCYFHSFVIAMYATKKSWNRDVFLTFMVKVASNSQNVFPSSWGLLGGFRKPQVNQGRKSVHEEYYLLEKIWIYQVRVLRLKSSSNKSLDWFPLTEKKSRENAMFYKKKSSWNNWRPTPTSWRWHSAGYRWS